MTAGHLGIPAPNQAALEELSAEAAYLDRAGQRPCGAVGQAIADRTFRVPAQQLAAAKAEAGGASYAYDFRWASSAGVAHGLAFHCLDIPFAFDALGEPGVREVTGPAPPASLAADMHGAWVRFVTDGDPAGSVTRQVKDRSWCSPSDHGPHPAS